MSDSAEIARQNLASTLFWYFHTGINCIALRDHGPVVAADIWRHVMLGQQHDHYHDGMRKLGIDQSEPPAVRAAKYHYLSNTVGGLRLHYVEESPRKVWIRYLAPLGSYPGMAMLASPIALRRTILSTWHPRNGELMSCPRLGWVLTKLVCFGEPYDEGYFIEYDHELKPEDRVRFEHVERTPEFDPARAPRLDEAQWPPVRIARASRNYAAGYLREAVEALRVVLGPLAAEAICRTAAACVAVQFTPSLVAQSGATGNSAPSIARFFAGLLHAGGDQFELEEVSPTLARIHLHSFQPFLGPETAALRDAFFQFQIVAARMLNGRVAVMRADASPSGSDQVWTIEDKGRWLW